jgi:hypothetical protein
MRFFPVTLLAEDNGLDNRLAKIERLIGSCKYGVHDLSRTELNEHLLPRFNMPFELGIFFGAKKFGDRQQKSKVAIILDIEPHRYTEFITDLRGVDINAHSNNVEIVIRKIREFLKTSSRRNTVPGHTIIIREYSNLLVNLPSIVDNLGLDIDSLPFNDYCYIVEEAIRAILQ